MQISSVVLKVNQINTYCSHNCWRWSFLYKQIFFNCHYQPFRHFEQWSLLGFYQGLTLIFLILLQWQIGFECWRKVSQQYYTIHPFLQKSLNVPQDLPNKKVLTFFFLCKGVLSFQTLSLGVMAPHITPVLYGNWVWSCNVQALQPSSL